MATSDEEKKIQWVTLQFTANGKDYSFDVVHNLERFGIGIQAALKSWLARTKGYDIDSFCQYVNEKDPNIMCA